MAKKKSSAPDDTDWVHIMRSESFRAVVGILCLAMMVFLVLSAFDIGGILGKSLFQGLSYLLGIGYALLPISFLLAAYILFKAHSERTVSPWQIGSVILFLFASLTLLATIFPGKGGLLGSAISTPLVHGVDFPAAVTFLLAFITASLIIIFDIHPGAIYAGLRKQIDDMSPTASEPETLVTSGVADADTDDGTVPEEVPDVPVA